MEDRFDSGASFRWVPQGVLVQCFRLKLAEKYRDYNMVHVVGEGRTADVFIVQHRGSEKNYACKLLKIADHNPAHLRREIETLRWLDHPNIVRLHETLEDEDSVCLIMELCQGGDLFTRIADDGCLSENEAKIYAEQMLSALAFCHRMGIVHRDVKPENFLLETEDPHCRTLKLADFGISTSIRPNKKARSLSGGAARTLHLPSFDAEELEAAQDSLKGSLPYIAPELFKHSWKSLTLSAKESNKLETLAAGDLWSCGIVIYVMLSGDLPFGSNIDAICSGQPPDFSKPLWASVSDEAKDLILKLVHPHPEERWTAKLALNHEWFTSGVTSPATAQSLREYSKDCPVDGLQLARELMRHLRQWRRLPKLRRICIAAIAKRLESDHPAVFLAKAAYRLFSSNSEPEVLRCEQLISAMSKALNSAEAMQAGMERVYTSGTSDDTSSMGSFNAEMSSPKKLEGPTWSGVHLRQRCKNFLKSETVMRRFAKINEESPQMSNGSSECLNFAEDLVSLTELKYLVGSLDGVKNGIVDYTLLVAAVLPRSVYCDEQRICEAFELFDFNKKGAIGPDDLRTFCHSQHTNLKQFQDMVKAYDANSDGVLDLSEFRRMVQGSDVKSTIALTIDSSSSRSPALTPGS